MLRYFVEKREGYDHKAAAYDRDFKLLYGISAAPRSLVRYEIEGLAPEYAEIARGTILHEPPVDRIYESIPELSAGSRVLAWESLPGQFDQRADSCEQCLALLTGGSRPVVRCAELLILHGVTESEYEKLKGYVINPVESRECGAGQGAEGEGGYSPAMGADDLECIREYFAGEGREPTETELRVLDTYWSDHCRHTTFLTELERIEIEDSRVRGAYEEYELAREELYGHGHGRAVSLMDIATCAAKVLKKRGQLPELDESEEINACSIVAGDHLLMFKNETHNHPTEIEPYGGAATCIGGAIRDPLSGRAYVYGSMRITGSGDPREPIERTLPGKLPQRKISTTAAAGFSSYGNQIGLATGVVREVYHPGYRAKRMEVGAVIGAVRRESVRRERPEAGDVVILVGGRTGRDGIGGATGSSKTHNAGSVDSCGAEVQKGNAPEERKLQRLFRKPEVARLIKRCNDFGAGGVSVAIGELAEGIEIDLDAVPRKYEGLDGTELAISESQERMAVVVAASDAEAFIAAASMENAEATIVARVTDAGRLVMRWRGEVIVDIARSFLDTNGARKRAAVRIGAVRTEAAEEREDLSICERTLKLVSDLSFCSQRGLGERFDGTIGTGSVFVPYGGRDGRVAAPILAMLIPGTETCSLMAHGFDPYLSERDTFTGAQEAVISSVAKLIAAGAVPESIYLSLQEYFPKPLDVPERWGLPMSALLGAFKAQMALGFAAIGGKDSMSGSFEDLDVPPTLISFAVTTVAAESVIRPEWSKAGERVYLLSCRLKDDGTPDYEGLRRIWGYFSELCGRGLVSSARACERGGVMGAIVSMSSGLGFVAEAELELCPFEERYGAIVFSSGAADGIDAQLLGEITDSGDINWQGDIMPYETLCKAWELPLENVFPTRSPGVPEAVPEVALCSRRPVISGRGVKPLAVIPVFSGTNCEDDTERALREAGAEVRQVVIRNLRPEWLESSVIAMAEALHGAQMLVFPGGFSAGDEPDGSGKFIATFFRNSRIADATMRLLREQDGLILGICNGFQSLVKLGLLPYGEIRSPGEGWPTLTYNKIGRHVSRYVYTRVTSVISPWLLDCEPGGVHRVPCSHGEGRFIAPEAELKRLASSGQIAFQYCDAAGAVSMQDEYNPNGSYWAIEGITSADGRILGKMAHSERAGRHLAKNLPGVSIQPIFSGGVKYFK